MKYICVILWNVFYLNSREHNAFFVNAIGRTSLMVVGGALCVLALTWLFLPSSTPRVETAVEAAVYSELGEAAGLTVDYSKAAGEWTLVCGTISGPDGAGLDALSATARERLSESADFCALVETSAPVTVRELDLGSTDMPAMDWMDKYALPPELLTGD